MKEFLVSSGLIISLALVMPLTSTAAEALPGEQMHPEKEGVNEQKVQSLSLEECLEIAVKNNRTRPASQFAVEIAEAQLQQSLSSYWPQLALTSTFSHIDHNPNFIFPVSSIGVPASSFTAITPLGTLPVNVPAQSINVPIQNIKLMNKDTLMTSLNATYPVYTGGQRPAIVKQARSGLESARQEARRTDLQVIYDVKRMYHGAVLARELHRIGSEALQRLEVTLELTEKLYKNGSGRVKKTDYLRNKSVVEALRSAVTFMKANEELTLSALINTMGLDWDTKIQVSEAQIPFNKYQANLRELMSNTYTFNPDWARMQEGLKAAEAKVDEAKSGHLPKIALTGSFTNIDNSYNQGIVTPDNKNSWNVGAVLKFPLFSGFRTREEIREAIARLGKLSEEGAAA